MEQNKTMKERLLDPTNKSDIPTITYVTTRAIVFYITAVLAVVGMFGNWFALDLNLGYVQLNEILGTVNPFTMVGAISDIEETLGMFSMLLPDEIIRGFGIIQFVSFVLMVLSAASVGLYVYAAFLRLKENDMTVRFGRIAALCAMTTVAVFVGLIIGLLASMGASAYIGSAIGKILTSSCLITLLCAAVSMWAAVMDTEFKENVVIYHNGILKIDRGPKWRCVGCGRKNLSLLDKCYYCGKEK